MNIDLDALFPDGIRDETAVVVADVLAELPMWWEAHYPVQIRRRTCNPCPFPDPEEGYHQHRVPPRTNPCPTNSTGRVPPEPPRDTARVSSRNRLGRRVEKRAGRYTGPTRLVGMVSACAQR